jgi:hypothetical protein
MAEVDWEKLSSKLFEDMVAVLLSLKNPEIRRIDGSGGDGGRDAEFPRDAGPEIFQLKSFTGRMRSGRRRQVEASLAKASTRNPVAWHLVVPIDPTPGEQQWFEGLRAGCQFPISWEGRTWLNGQMAERPFIPRYFLEGESDRVVEMLSQLREEQAAVTDIRVGMERLRALAERINEIDPYYRFDVSVRGKTVEVQVHPRYEGAELDHPITFDIRFAFPGTEEGRAVAAELQAAMDFGTPVSVEGQYIESANINAPAGFGGSLSKGGFFKLGPPQPADAWALDIVLCAMTPEGVSVAELPITLTERTHGLRGAVVSGSDRPKTFHVSMQFNLETKRVHLNFKFSSTADHLPHDLLPALAFIRGILAPNRVQVLLGDDRVPLGDSIETPTFPLVEEEYVQLVKDLAKVQRETGTFFPMPPKISRQDLQELSEAVDLLDRKGISQSWDEASFVLDVAEPQRFLQEVGSKPEGAAYLIEGEATATIAGHTIPLGRMRTHIPEAVVSNMEEVTKALEATDEEAESTAVKVILKSIGEKTFKRSLVPGKGSS